ncbi:MAG: hypothetical protein GEV10_01590 [Streptosporangiales bacterium]|nr:hypothetical protein [Streptosporangiales bacterium]
MAGTDVLTSDDLDEIGATTLKRGDDPRRVAASLVEAVDQDRLADPADAAYALCLAAELSAEGDDLVSALAQVDRAVAADRGSDAGLGAGYARALRAELLYRLDRVDDAMVALTALRPQLSRDPEAAYYVTDALEAMDRTELAEQWLTEALDLAVPKDDVAQEPSAGDDAVEPVQVFNALLQSRHRVRRELDLPHDAHDDLADELHEIHTAPHDVEGVAELFWPRAEFDRLRARWPELTETYGGSWDEHRATVECALATASAQGAARLAVLAASVDEYADLAADLDADATDPSVRDRYVEDADDDARFVPWPPGRNDACWCESGAKYKKCCLPRSRG